jgi:indole-3-glycerol phosphate synthase
MGEPRPDVLQAIVGAARRVVEVRRATTSDSELERLAASAPRARMGLADALERGAAPRVIAECKRRSPSRGVLRRDYDPVLLARDYVSAGAAAISVLTESTFFDGTPQHLRDVRAAVDLPLLRKDFILDEYQLLEGRAWGADAVLLIVAALTDDALKLLLGRAEALGLDALVEVHDERELDRALDAGARILGVNNRNLRTLTVDAETTARLGARIPAGVVGVAESGLRSRADLTRLSNAGYRAFLVGERLVSAANPGAALRELVHA